MRGAGGKKIDALLFCAVALVVIAGLVLFARGTPVALGPYASVASVSGEGLLYVDGEPRIDLNTADAGLLQTLPGIGPVLAEEIVADREANGPFRTIEEVTRVKGIGEKKFAAMRAMIAVDADLSG